MKNKTTVMLLVLIILISGCTTSFMTKQVKTMSREEAEANALKFVYEHTSNKEIYDREITVKNYVFDSWKEENVWHVILYVSHTFIEVLVYDDGTDQIKVLTKTDYWKKVPPDVKTKIFQDTNKDTGVGIS
jgi:cell division protein FtsI/penicillin-binding protein 2